MLAKIAATSQVAFDAESSPASEFGAGALFRETLGEVDQNTSIGRIPDFSEGNDEPQSFDNIQVDFIVGKQL
jgi:hypothetical protein